jgi:hypothetical protein
MDSSEQSTKFVHLKFDSHFWRINVNMLCRNFTSADLIQFVLASFSSKRKFNLILADNFGLFECSNGIERLIDNKTKIKDFLFNIILSNDECKLIIREKSSIEYDQYKILSNSQMNKIKRFYNEIKSKNSSKDLSFQRKSIDKKRYKPNGKLMPSSEIFAHTKTSDQCVRIVAKKYKVYKCKIFKTKFVTDKNFIEQVYYEKQIEIKEFDLS